MVARITISHNNVITIEASSETLNLLNEEFKAPDFSECFVFGQFRKERMKMVKFLIRSPEVPTTALLPIGFLKDLVIFFKKHNATFKVIDNRKFEKIELSDEEIEKCLGYINLYDYQVEAVKAMLEAPNGIIKATTAAGKCLAKGTKVLMYDGSLKNVENILIGEQIMGPDSTPRNILSICSGQEMMYDIIPKKGTKYRVNESHILSLKMTKGCGKKRSGSIIDISVRDYLKQSKTFKHCAKGYRVAIDWKEQLLPSHLDPYFLGVWLGDGSSSNPAITNIDSEIINYLYKYSKEKNMRLYEDLSNTRITSYRFTSTNGRADAGRGHKSNIILNQLRTLNLIGNKHIPQIYKINSMENRLQLLAGLIDTDGSYDGRGFDYITKSKKLARDVVFTARSVGLAAYVHGCKKNAHANHEDIYYRIYISGDIDIIPTKIVRKQASPRKQKKDVLVYGIEVKPVGVGTYYGFEIDGDKRFVLGDFSVTHNTEVFIAYCKLTKRKTLILFARIDLAKQTLRRMKKAGLDAGIVQGNNVDENHQVVMATVQSGHKLESQYDCIIVDECFTAKTEVMTEYGKDTIENICRNKKKINVWSFNINTNTFELKPVTNWIIKKTNNLVQININSTSNIKCTPNHKFYVFENGNILQKKAGNLTPNDNILLKNNNHINNGFAPVLSKKQYQAVLGMVLGDASIGKSKNLARLRFAQGESQVDYLIHKKNILGNMFNKHTTHYSGKSGYNPNKKIHYIATRCSQDFKDLYDAIYFNGSKSITNIINKIDEVSLAYWFMDDGSISYNNIKNPTPTAHLATHSFTEKENELIIDILKSKFGLDAFIMRDKRCNKYYLRFNTESTKSLSKLISKYVPLCMNYKVLLEDRGNHIETDFENLDFSMLKPKSIVTFNNKETEVFDITVEDNHNYVIGSGYVVSNCHRAQSEQYQALLKNKHTLYRYGFSATPFVNKNKLQTKRVTAWLGNILYTVHAEKLMDEGRISKPTIHIIPIKKPTDIGDLKWPFAETAGIIENKYRNDIIAEVTNNLDGQKLILVQKIDHGERLEALINNSYFLYGESDVKEREEYVARFEAGEPITLIASTIFDEGIDIKTVNHVIITGGGQSFIKVLQRLGRGLRITETKKTVDIYDFYDYTNPTLKKHSDERIKIYRSEGFNEIRVFKIEEFRKDSI